MVTVDSVPHIRYVGQELIAASTEASRGGAKGHAIDGQGWRIFHRKDGTLQRKIRSTRRRWTCSLCLLSPSTLKGVFWAANNAYYVGFTIAYVGTKRVHNEPLTEGKPLVLLLEKKGKVCDDGKALKLHFVLH